MGKKEIETAAKKLQEYYAHSPDWYWKGGLHDAVILSAALLELTPNYQDRYPRWNCLELLLDGRQALYDDSVSAIRLFNCKINPPDLDLSELTNAWWMWDHIQQLPNGRYLLDVTVMLPGKHQKNFVVQFQIPEIEHKEPDLQKYAGRRYFRR